MTETIYLKIEIPKVEDKYNNPDSLKRGIRNSIGEYLWARNINVDNLRIKPLIEIMNITDIRDIKIDLCLSD